MVEMREKRAEREAASAAREAARRRRRRRRRRREPTPLPRPTGRRGDAPRESPRPARRARRPARGRSQRKQLLGVFVSLEGIDRSGKTTQAGCWPRRSGRGRCCFASRAGRMRRADPRAAQGPGASSSTRWPSCSCSVPRGPSSVAQVIRPALEAAATWSATASSTPPSPTRAPRGGSASELVESSERDRDRRAAARPDVLLRIDPGGAEARGQQRWRAGARGRHDRFEAEGIEFQRRSPTPTRSSRPVTRSGSWSSTPRDRRGRPCAGDGGGGHGAARALEPDRRCRSTCRRLREPPSTSPRRRAALAAALAVARARLPVAGPAGSGKRAAARAFAAELLADGAPDPDDARRRGAGRSVTAPRPGLAGAARHTASGRRGPRAGDHGRRLPALRGGTARIRHRGGGRNGGREPERAPEDAGGAGGLRAHPAHQRRAGAALLETVRSRCQEVRFAPTRRGGGGGRIPERGLGEPTASAWRRRAWRRRHRGARVPLGDERGRELRAVAAECVAAALSGELESAPWRGMLAAAESAGDRAGEETVGGSPRPRPSQAEEGRAGRRAAREAEEAGRRASRRARTEALDAGSALAAWLRDLAALADGAEESRHERGPA